MIECIFSIDYEIYGNGQGKLLEQVFEPAERLKHIFDRHNARFVVFAEASEFEIIEAAGTDPGSAAIKRQLREFHEQGYEIALHLHPQWYRARREGERWLLNYDEYNLCTLPESEINAIVDRSVEYLRGAVGDSSFTPLSFRAGNWLFQPSRVAAAVLYRKGIRLDSSVFKGGLQRRLGLDYRAARANGDYWWFDSDLCVAEPNGKMLEVPTYTRMVPFWKMLTAKRVGLQQRSPSTPQKLGQRLARYLDYARPFYPLKFDFCRMSFEEMRTIVQRAVGDQHPKSYLPLVAIGHTKDLFDFEAVDRFLAWLCEKEIEVTTFPTVYERCCRAANRPVQAPVSRHGDELLRR